jgi:hypothetical protein
MEEHAHAYICVVPLQRVFIHKIDPPVALITEVTASPEATLGIDNKITVLTK